MSTNPPIRWPAADPVVADGRRIALRRLGDPRREEPGAGEVPVGVPALLLHGLHGTGMQWNRLAPLLARGRQVLVPDLPGFGGSEDRGAYTVSAVSATLAELVLEEAGRPVDVVGHDWGATLAIALAGVRPDLVRRLGVISGAWPPWLAAGPANAAPGLTRWQRCVEGLGAAAPRRVAGGYLAADPALSGAPRPQRSLVIWGAKDRRLPPRYGERVLTALGRWAPPPTVEMITLPGVDSVPHVSAPEAVGALLCDFLRGF